MKISGNVYEFPNYIVQISDNGDRTVISKDETFHLRMLYKTGVTLKWGKTFEEDPTHCPFGPEIADIEVTTKCSGIRTKDGKRYPCPWCYKSNSSYGHNMSFKTFKHIFDMLNKNKTLTQIAFGADASLESNPDIWKMFEYCRENYVVPNVTVADISPDTAKKIVEMCGAVAVSWYPDLNCDRCFDTVRLLIDESKKQNKNMQVNIHALLSKSTIEYFPSLVASYRCDKRLDGMNAIVLLSLKKKGRGKNYDIASQDDFEHLIDTFLANKVSFGMDSCSANKFLTYLSKHPELDYMKAMIEPCESTLFSSYINCKGIYYPCSFMEGEGEWKEGIDLKDITDFENEVWNHEKVVAFRNAAINKIKCNGCNSCPYYEV